MRRPLKLTILTAAWVLMLFWPGLPVLSAGEVTLNTSAKVAAYFEKAKTNESLLTAFLHHMPKGADLHNHLYGAVEAEAILDSAAAKGLFFDRDSGTFTTDKPAGPYFGPNEITSPFWRRAEVLEAISMRNRELNGESGHGHFFRSFYRFISALADDRELLRDFFIRAVNQRISYLEIMTYPGDRNWVAEVEAAKNVILADFEAQGLKWNLEVRYIYPLDRNAELDQFKSELAKGLAAAQDPGRATVGLTMLSPEDDHISQRDFMAQMETINTAWLELDAAHQSDQAQNPPPPFFTIHAGELTLEYAAYSTMLDRISKTIELGHASRIGHGVSIMWENQVYGLLKRMRDQAVAVEICLTSNDGILKVSGGGRHPFRLYWEAGVPVVLATDDEGLSRSNLTVEFAKAAQWFDLSYGEMKWLAFNSLEYSFLPGESYFENGDFNRPKKEAAAVTRKSAKARLQRELLTAFDDFEREREGVIEDFGW